MKDQGIIFKGWYCGSDQGECGKQSIAFARGFDKGSISLTKCSFEL